jgi:hypothetical protein
MSFTTSRSLTVPLSRAAHEMALQFAAEQANSQKGKQVYLNTLAVWAVQQYLAWLQIDADLEASQSWHPHLRALFDVADLMLPKVGRLECRPVLPDEEDVDLPVGNKGDRFGYLAVRFQESLQEAELLGFVAATEVNDDAETLPLQMFQPLDSLLDWLAEHPSFTDIAAEDGNDKVLVHLQGWLQRSFEAGWQAVEDLFRASTPGLAFRRSAIRRAKQLDLPNVQRPGTPAIPVALVLTVWCDRPDQFGIHLHLCTLGETTYLPSQLQLRILTDTGDVFRQITAGEADTFVQYEFTAQAGEGFSVGISSGTTQIVQSFLL